MVPTEVLTLLSGSGGCIVALALGIWLVVQGRLIPKSTHDAIVRDKDSQIADLTRAVATERQRSDAATLAAQASKDVLMALQQLRPPDHG